MRLLWIAIVLALFKCNYGEEDVTVDPKLIEQLFGPTEVPESSASTESKGPIESTRPIESTGPSDRSENPNPPVPSENSTPDKTCSTCNTIAENPSLIPKVSNVSHIALSEPLD